MKQIFAALLTITLLAVCAMTAYAQPFNPDGVWYDPEQPGYGLVIAEGNEGTFLALFTYNVEHSPLGVGQAWYVGFELAPEVPFESPFVAEYELNRPSGVFPAAGWHQVAPTLTLTVEEVDLNRIFVEWRFNGEAPCFVPMVSPMPWYCWNAVILERFLTPTEDAVVQ